MNSMADNQKVYQAIKTIADELCKENKTYLRADLAFELKKYGIASDSSEVSKLVFDAYRYFHDNGNIAIAFVSNNSAQVRKSVDSPPGMLTKKSSSHGTCFPTFQSHTKFRYLIVSIKLLTIITHTKHNAILSCFRKLKRFITY